MKDEKKVSLEKYRIFDNENLIWSSVANFEYDSNELLQDFDENGNVVKKTYQTTKTLEDGKKHVLKLEVFYQNKSRFETLSLNDEKIIKWVYDENGILKEEKDANKILIFKMGFMKQMTFFTPNKYIFCGINDFPLMVIHEPSKFYDYKIDKYDLWETHLVKMKIFTKNNPKFEDKETVYKTWEEGGIKQWTKKYLWNPKLNSYEEWIYDKNNKLKTYYWNNPSNDESFSVKYDDKNKKVDLLYGKPNNKWTDKKINNIEFKDNDTFKNTAYYLLDKREEIKQGKEFEFELKYLDISEIKRLKR